MSVSIFFTPSAVTSPPFSTTVTLDGQPYTLTTAWNAYAARWYYSLVNQNGVLIITAPLIESPPDYPIPLAPGLFTSTLVFYGDTQTFVVT